MLEMNEHVLEALRGELKVAFSPRVSSMLGALGSGAGVGAAAGAVGGAVLKGGKAYHDARQDGAGVGDAVTSGLLHAGGGVVRGALTGAAIGGAGGAMLGHVRPEMAERFRQAASKLPGGQFGQRQVHTLTGWKPQGGLGEIGHGAAPRLGVLRAAEKGAIDAKGGVDNRGRVAKTVDKVLGRSAVDRANKGVDSARDAYSAGRKAEDMGLTSIPGYAKSLVKHPGATLKASLNDQWKGMSPGMKALTVGAPALELAGAARGPAVDENGKTRGERIGRGLAGTAGGMLLSPLTMSGQILAGTALSGAGGAAGRLASKRPKAPGIVHAAGQSPDLTADNGQAVAGERQISDRAAGSPASEGFSA